MGRRQEILTDIIGKKYPVGRFYRNPGPIAFNNSIYHKEIEEMYLLLGGIQKYYPTGYKGYDLQSENFIIELDEERHFNRYRLLTLKSNFYSNHESFIVDDYIDFCTKYENCCLASANWKKNWTTDSSEIQFGSSNIEGCLQDPGSARWKQRAFYDFLRDVSCKLINVPLIRVSIWEQVDSVKDLNYYLFCNDSEKVLEFVDEKIKLHSC